MRKYFLVIAGLLLTLAVSAQEKEWHYRNHINVYKTIGTMNIEGDMTVFGINENTGKYTGHYGFGGSIGHTFPISKAIANDFRFGIEATWADFNYSKYQYDGPVDVEYSKFEFSMGVGVSFAYQPIQDLYIKPYVMVFPGIRTLGSTTPATTSDEKDKHSGSVQINGSASFGLNAAYKNIGAGFEYRTGSLTSLTLGLFSVTGGSYDDWRFYVQLNF